MPATYSSVVVTNGDAQDPEGSGCSLWQIPDELDNFYHPDGYFEMRSESVAGGHGHQAVYSNTGTLITAGPSSGSADRTTPGLLSATTHFTNDVLPYVWAAQMDGNPVQAKFIPTDMNAPMMHFGVYLNRYLQCRPPVPNDKPFLQPGACP